MKKIKNSHQIKEEKLLKAKLLAIQTKIENIQLRYDNKEISFDEYGSLYNDALDEKDSLYTITREENTNAKFNYFMLGTIAAVIVTVITDTMVNKKD